MEDVPLRTPERAAKTAARHNKKLAQRFPLLALGNQLELVADMWTAERVMADERRFRAAMDAADQRARTRGDALRDLVSQRVSGDELAAMDAHFRRVLPQDDAGYWSDYWWCKLRQIWPERAQQMCPNAHLHATFAKFQPLCHTCGGVLATEDQT